MEILKLQGAYKDNIWGGHRLVEQFNKVTDMPVLAESWELSAHPDGSSIILNGEFAGQLFKDYIAQHSKDIWGTNAARYDEFPILIKYIDAKQALSIQVHPDDDYAQRVEGEFGKNEFWYVLDAEPGAFLYYGVKHEMTKEEYRRYIEDETICDHLNKVEVHPGDCFFIKAGTIHAIGAGVLIAEIQQSSNSTYRVYDFGRLGVDGKPRELHIDKAVDVSILTPSGKNGEADEPKRQHATYDSQILTNNPYFICKKYNVYDHVNLKITKDWFQSLVVLEGEAVLRAPKNVVEMKKGDSIFIPSFEGSYDIDGNVSFIQTFIVQ